MKPFTKNLSFGSIGQDVISLQLELQKEGYNTFVPTGFFGAKTKQAVIDFQTKNNIKPAIGNFFELTRRCMNLKLFTKSEILYQTALDLIGIDASPLDRADDEYGCADSVNTINLDAFGYEIGGTTSTHEMYKYLQNSALYTKTITPVRGDVLISPTGHGNGRLDSGHVGIYAGDGKIMSNSSSTGTWQQNYNLETWKARYVEIGGFPMEFYHLN